MSSLYSNKKKALLAIFNNHNTYKQHQQKKYRYHNKNDRYINMQLDYNTFWQYGTQAFSFGKIIITQHVNVCTGSNVVLISKES